jgi:hypothetical protein
MFNTTEWQAKQAARAFAAAQLHIAFPHLVPVSDKVDSLVAAAKNIRIELARAFPAVKFSVKSRRFSGGDAIDVRWIDGPTSKQVDAIIERYEAGSFDGMTDSYDYRGDKAWVDAFGDAKYVHSSRDLSDKLIAAVMARVCRLYGVACPTIADYRAGKVYRLTNEHGSDVASRISEALSRHTCAIAKVQA